MPLDLTELLRTDGVPLLRERGGGAAGGAPLPPPEPVTPVGGIGRRFPRPRKSARTYVEVEDAELEPHLAGEDEDEDETVEFEDGEAEMLSVFETALSGLQTVVAVMRRRRTTSGPEERGRAIYD